MSRHSLSRKAKRKTQVLVKLCEEGNGFTCVTYPTPLVEISFKSNGDFRVFESRKLIMNAVMKALTSDGISIIGICGMGGVGKTTLVNEVAKVAKENKLFDKVVMVAVSRNSDLIKIQGDIAEMLDFQFFWGSTLLARARKLRTRILNSKSILVILDDVWNRLQLNEIGIPFGDDHKGCKIMLTSRSDDVCRNGMSVGQIFPVDVLSKEEAWNLFKEKAGISNDSTGHTIDFPYKEVANECGCLPIAIVTVARALKGKDKHSWDSALQQLRNSIAKNLRGVEKDVLQLLEWSYNSLDSEEAKKCFLLCSLYPEDSKIPIEELVRYGIGLKLFERVDSVDEARVRVHALVDDLKTRYLLMYDESNYEESFVKIHDVMRDVAISIASREEHSFMVRCDKPLEDWPEDTRRQNYAVISFSLTGMHKLPGDLEFPKLQLLQLVCKGEVLDTPDCFFKGMKELKVATFSNMSFRRLPTSVPFLSNLKALSLSDCESIDDVSVIGALTNLEILRFINSGIRELPKEIGDLSHLKLLELADCVVERICPGVLSSLVQLEELYIGESFDKWDVVEQGKERTNASIAELASLSNLVALKISVQLNDVKFWPKDLDLKKVEKFDIIIGKPYPNHVQLPLEGLGYYFSHLQNRLMFRFVDVSHLMETGLKNLLKRIRILHLESVKGSMNIFSGLGRDDFAELKDLTIDDCGDLEYLINTADWVPHTAFNGLEDLKLIRLPALTHVWKGSTQFVCLRNLTSVHVADCEKLKSVFSISIARQLIQLQSIYIMRSDKVEVIVSSEGREYEIVPADKVVFPKLARLHLASLPSFTALCKDTSAIKMPELKILYLSQIPKLQYLCPHSESNHNSVIQPLFHDKVTLTNIEELGFHAMENLVEIWPEELQAKLRRLDVIDCNKLSNIIFSPNLIECMQNLEILEVRRCQSVEVVFNLERLDVGEGHPAIALPCLKELKFDCLPKLTHVWANDSAHSQGFQNLTIISVQNCDSLRNLFSPSMAKLLVKLQELEIIECEVMEAIVAHEQEVDGVTRNTIIFPELTDLTLKDLSNLTSFFQQDYAFEGSFLKKVEVVRCPKTKLLPSTSQGLRDQYDVSDVLELSVKHCDDVEYLVNTTDQVMHRAFDSLEELCLEYLHALTHLWKRPSQFVWLHNLRSVDVGECEKLESVFSFSTENPNKTEVIVLNEGGEHEIVATDKIVLPKLYEMMLRGLPSFTAFCDALIAIELPELEELYLEKIPKLQYLCPASKSNCYSHSVSQSLFCNQVNLTSIEVMTLYDMDNLIEIWPGELQAKLKSLEVRNCQKLSNILFSSNLIECMQNLEDIGVSFQSVEVAFDLGGLDVGEGHPAGALPCLEVLDLRHLPKLADVWVNNSPRSQGFQNLRVLRVEKCDSLRNLFSPSIAKLLVKLQELEITECEVMETIIAQEQEVDEEVKTNTIIFSQLTDLKLMDLPNLTSFCKKDYIFEGSFLERVEVIRCPKMEALPSAPQQLREQYDM